MARTLLEADDVATGALTRALLNTTTAGSAVIAKVIAGTGVSLTSTGADAGTGDVTITAVAQPASVPPLMNGTQALGSSTLYARQDHIHPSDTSRAPAASPTFTTSASVTSGTYYTNVFSNLANGSYNPIVQTNDNAIIFSTGTSGAGALCIAPWSPTGSGIRLTPGSTAVTGTLSVSGALSAGSINSTGDIIAQSGHFVAGNGALCLDGGSSGIYLRIDTTNGVDTSYSTAMTISAAGAVSIPGALSAGSINSTGAITAASITSTGYGIFDNGIFIGTGGQQYIYDASAGAMGVRAGVSGADVYFSFATDGFHAPNGGGFFTGPVTCYGLTNYSGATQLNGGTLVSSDSINVGGYTRAQLTTLFPAVNSSGGAGFAFNYSDGEGETDLFINRNGGNGGSGGGLYIYDVPSTTGSPTQIMQLTGAGALSVPGAVSAASAILKGSSTGTTTLSSANASTTSYTLTLPSITDTVATVSTSPFVVSNVVGLRALTQTTPVPVIETQGYTTAGDGGAAVYVYVAGSGLADNGGGVIHDGSGHVYVISVSSPIFPKQWGAVGNGTTDDSAALTAMFNYVQNAAAYAQESFYTILGGGLSYATSLPLTVPKNVSIQDFSLFALAGASWNGNSGNALFGYGTNGILNIPSTVYGINLTNVFVDCNRIANVQGIYCASPGNIAFTNVNVRHWTSGGNGVIMVAGGTVNMYNMGCQQWVASDAEYSVLADQYGMAIGFFGSYDSTIVGGNFAHTLVPMYIDPTSCYMRFIGVHVYQNGMGGSAWANPYGIVYDGYNCVFDGTYLDSAPFLIRTSSSSNSTRPQVVITNTNGLYNSAQTTFTAWFQFTTSVASTPIWNVKISNNSLPFIQPFLFSTTGSGTWSMSTAVLARLNSASISESYLNAITGGSTVQFGPNIDLAGTQTLRGELRVVNWQTGNYTVTADDSGTIIALNSGTTPAVTLSATAAIGTNCEVVSVNAAGTVAAASGATLMGATATLPLTQNQIYKLVCINAAQWVMR